MSKRGKINEIYDVACAEARAFLEQELQRFKAQLNTSGPAMDEKTRKALFSKVHRRADEGMSQIMLRAKKKVDMLDGATPDKNGDIN